MQLISVCHSIRQPRIFELFPLCCCVLLEPVAPSWPSNRTLSVVQFQFVTLTESLASAKFPVETALSMIALWQLFGSHCSALRYYNSSVIAIIYDINITSIRICSDYLKFKWLPNIIDKYSNNWYHFMNILFNKRNDCDDLYKEINAYINVIEVIMVDRI